MRKCFTKLLQHRSKGMPLLHLCLFTDILSTWKIVIINGFVQPQAHLVPNLVKLLCMGYGYALMYIGILVINESQERLCAGDFRYFYFSKNSAA